MHTFSTDSDQSITHTLTSRVAVLQLMHNLFTIAKSTAIPFLDLVSSYFQ